MAENVNEQGGEKLFSQAELDSIVGKRLAEERKKFPTAEEMTAFKAYKAAQETEADKIANLTAEKSKADADLQSARGEIARLTHERFLLGKGVPAEDLEYYDFKISKTVSDTKTYEQAAEEFLKDRKPAVRVDMGGSLGEGRGTATASSLMNDLIRNAAKH